VRQSNIEAINYNSSNDTKSKKRNLQEVLKDVGVHFAVDEIMLGLGNSFSRKLKNSQTYKIMDKYRTSLKEILDRLSPQKMLESDKDGSEIIDIAIKEVEMKKWHVRWLGYFDAEIKIITDMKGKNKEMRYRILPQMDGSPNLKKRPLTDKEFSQYVEITGNNCRETC
jgi:hypothetical protein